MFALPNLKKFSAKSYRDGYLKSQVGAGISYQIQALRAKFGLTQAKFADLIGKPQAVVSRLENSHNAKVSVQTLLDIAHGCDVALIIQFASYPEFLRRTSNMTEAALQPETIQETLTRLEGGSLAGIEMPFPMPSRAEKPQWEAGENSEHESHEWLSRLAGDFNRAQVHQWN